MKDVPAHFERWLRRSGAYRTRTSLDRTRCIRAADPLGRTFQWASYSIEKSTGAIPAVIDLWSLREAPADRASFDQVCGSLEIANCSKDEFVESLLLRAQTPSRRIALRANLVFPCAHSDPVLTRAAQSGTRVRLWTYSFLKSGIEVFPYCPAPPSEVNSADRPFERLLATLSPPARRADASPSDGLSLERRRFDRRPVSIRTRVGFPGIGRRGVREGRATISDLSRRGARLTDFSPETALAALKAGAVELTPSAPRGGSSVFGKVVRLYLRNSSASLGIEFPPGSLQGGKRSGLQNRSGGTDGESRRS